MKRLRCGAWDGNQCKSTTKLTACVITTIQGSILKVPPKVATYLCSKHFSLDRLEPVPQETKK